MEEEKKGEEVEEGVIQIPQMNIIRMLRMKPRMKILC
jgi:hypothetical protein